MADLRIAVIGAGIIGRTHIETIAATPGFRLSAIVDPAPSAATLAADNGVPFHRSVEELIAAKAADGAIVASPTETHRAIATVLVEAGVPVLLEKPVAGSLADAAALVAAVARTGTPLLVGHHRRHNPIIAAAHAAIAAGAIGELVVATVTSSLMKPADYFDAAWRRTPGVGGPLLINLIHEVDLMRHFFGDVAAVRAIASNAVRGFGVEDTAGAVVRFARGGIATFAISDAAVGPWAWDLSSGENLKRFPAYPVQSHLLSGTEGGLGLPDLVLWRHAGEKSWVNTLEQSRLEFAPGDPYVAQLKHFGELVAGRAEPVVSCLEGAKDLATIEAMARAAESGGEVAPDNALLEAAAAGETAKAAP